MNRTTNLAVLAVLASAPQAFGQGVSPAFKLVSGKRVFLSEHKLHSIRGTGAGKASPDKKSLTYKGGVARLVVNTGPEEDMMSFWIQGLRNPTLVVKPAAKLKVLFVNTDEDMLHNIRFSAGKPPYALEPGARAVGSDDLPHAKTGKFVGEEMILKAPSQPGTYYYLCTVKGHAKAGMYGTLEVRP